MALVLIYRRLSIFFICLPFGLLFLLSAGGCTVAPVSIPVPPSSIPQAVLQIAETAAPTSNVFPTLEPSPSATLVPPTPLPTPSETPEPEHPACLDQPGQVLKDSLTTSFLREPLDFQVYLPPCYAETPGRRYPVLYLIHGLSNTDQQWVDLGATRTADWLIQQGKAAPLIIVMPEDRTWTQPVDSGFDDAVISNLLPHIDATFRTLNDRKYRAVGGLSRGGGWAVHFGLKYWQKFGAMGANSLALFWEDVANIKIWLDSIPPEQMPRIYLDIGDRDQPEIMDSAVWFEGILTGRDIPHEWHLFNGYHEDKYWSAHVEQYLLWYTAEW